MHLIGLQGLSRDEIRGFLDSSERFLDEKGNPFTPPEFKETLAGKTLALLFLEPSTRTRTSFEIAASRLGARTVTVNEAGSSLVKGESAADTCRTLAAMGVDGFVVRHHDRQLPLVLQDRLQQPIINAGNGSGEHPTQGLLDALTIRRHFKLKDDLTGMKVAIMGDVVHSRVARSDAHAFSALGAEVRLVGPRRLLPSEENLHNWPATLSDSRKETLRWADAVVVLRIQQERMLGQAIDTHEYAMDWGIDSTVVDRYLKPEAVILHPGPVIRGVELSDPVVDSDRSLILKQVTHGVAVRQAVLLRLLAEDS